MHIKMAEQTAQRVVRFRLCLILCKGLKLLAPKSNVTFIHNIRKQKQPLQHYLQQRLWQPLLLYQNQYQVKTCQKCRAFQQPHERKDQADLLVPMKTMEVIKYHNNIDLFFTLIVP